MSTNKKNRHLSKFLSLVLRHKPETIDLKLDEYGWADVEKLLSKMHEAQKQIDLALLKEIVATNDKQRFTFNSDYSKIRANQGHSIEIDLDLKPIQPPSTLYHGTSDKSIDSILQTGLEKRNRQHVHLSSDLETASKVGQRHGKLILLQVESGKMYEDGHLFYQSKNGVWLTDAVACLLYTSPSPRDLSTSRMPSSA